ncbi:intermembrane lipid transfer protein VPS13C isoform X2 [Engraulis encrasicolus]|uniref:intermembrane lipid transfer protein VPS13C isoform X2 n=1 Tax=Engraulis encrasicolus TaxID=184585 RepID=UPI002FD3CD28
MVFESIVSDLLNRFIGNYVENLDKSQLKIGIWGGNVVLENLRVKENALSEFDVPFKVKAGQIGKLSLKIPWKNLYNDAVLATLEDLYVLVVPGTSMKYDAEKEEHYLQEAKQKELQRIDDALQMAAQREKPKEEKKDSFVEKLATQVLKNLQVKVTNIHIRFEDGVSNPEKPLSIGVTLAELSLQTTDANWNPCILDEASKVFFKLGCLKSLCAYWNTTRACLSCGSREEIVDSLRAGVNINDQQLKDFEYIFKPIFATAKICINPNAEVELKSPKVTLHLEVDKISLDLTKPQYLTMVELLESLDNMMKNAPYRKFRPEVPVHTNARQWWQYGIQSVLEVRIRHMREMWSWSYIRKHRERLRAYRAAYKSHLIKGKLKSDSDTQITELEKVLDVFNITMARQQAQMEVIKSGQKVVANTEGTQKQSGGFFRNLFWRKSTEQQRKDGEDEEETKLKPLDAILTSDEKEKLYTAIGYSGSSHNLALPKQYIAVVVSVKLTRTWITLRETEDAPETLKVQVVELTTEISQRPGAQAIKLEAGLQHWYVTGLQQRGVVPSIITSLGTNTSSLLSVRFEVNPEDSTADQLLYIQSQPVEIIYDAVTVNTLAEFFKPTKEVNLDAISSATRLKLEEIKEKTTAGLSHIIKTRKILDLRIDLKPSYFILPFSGFSEDDTDLMMLDFGSFLLCSVDQTSRQALPRQSLEDVMNQAYERYSFELRNVQVLYSRAGKGWQAARQKGASPMHILQPMNFTLQLSKCMVDQDSRMPRFKLTGELPLLHVKVSEQKLKGVYSLLNSIPLPSASDPPTNKGLTTSLMNTRTALNASALLDFDTDSDEEDISEDEELKKLKNAELTDLQFKFEVKEVLLQLTQDDSSEKCILACACQLSAEGNLRRYDMEVTSHLHKVILDHYDVQDPSNQPLHLIQSFDAHDGDLLKVVFKKADPEGPHFLNTFQSTEQTLEVEFSSVAFLLHTRALMSCMSCLTSALPEELTARTEKHRESGSLAKDNDKAEVKGLRNEGVALRVVAVLGCIGVRVCDDEADIADIKIQGIDASATIQAEKTEVFIRLKDIAVMDINPDSVHKKVVSIVGEEVFSLNMKLYNNATEKEGYLDTSKVDGSIVLTLGCIEIVYLHTFFLSLLTFMDNFQAAKSALTVATSQAAEIAASSVKDLAQKSFRLAMDVRLKAPLVVIPQSSSCFDALVVDLGLITVANEFNLIPADDDGPLPALLEKMDIKLTQLKLIRKYTKCGAGSCEVELLEPINLELQVKRNLSSAWFHKIPGLELRGVLEAMHLSVGEDDVGLLAKILVENIGEERNRSDVHTPDSIAGHLNGVNGLNSSEGLIDVSTLEAGDLHSVPKENGIGGNRVNVLLNFEIKEVTMTLKKTVEEVEVSFLVFNVSQLGVNMTVCTHDLSATAYIQAITLKCLETTDEDKEHLCLVSSSVEYGTELLKVQYAKADKNGPEFMTTHDNTEQTINVLFSSLDVKLHTEAVVSVLNYFSNLSNRLPTRNVTVDMETKDLEEFSPQSNRCGSESPVDGSVIDLKILVKLGALKVLLCDHMSDIAEVRIQGLEGSLLTQRSETHISTSLKDFILENVDPQTLHTQAISIAGDEVFRFNMSWTPKATEGDGYADMTKMDGSVKLCLGCFRIVYLHKFIMSLLNFPSNFHPAAKGTLTAATTHVAERAASSVRDLAQRSLRLALDVSLKAPVIIIPQTSSSPDVLLADLGLITVGNVFSLLPMEEEGSLPVVFEHMNVNLTQLKLSRGRLNDSFNSEILEPVNLVLSVQRNLASSWYRSAPTLEIHGDLKPMKVSLSQEDLRMALSILMDNVGEASVGSTEKAIGLQHSSVHTVEHPTALDLNLAQTIKQTETAELLEDPVETLKFSFNINSLGLILLGSNSQKVSGQMKDHPFGEFTLHEISTEGKVLSDGSLATSAVLKNCTLYDHRSTGERATSRILGRQNEENMASMIDVKYSDNTTERDVVLVSQNLYLCASVEFLLAVADFFIQAMPKAASPPTQVDNRAAQPPQLKQTSDTSGLSHSPPVTKHSTSVHVVVVDPEIVFVANQACVQAPSFVASFQCDCLLKSDEKLLTLSTIIRKFQLLACPFIHHEENKTVSTVVQPCSVMLEGKMDVSGPIHVSVDIEEIVMKISPVIINTLLTITAAMTPKLPLEQQQHQKGEEELTGSDLSTLWHVRDVGSCPYWFLGVGDAEEVTEDFSDPTENCRRPGDENFRFRVKVVQLTLESGLGHQTLPLLLAESSLALEAHDWSSRLHLNSALTLEVNYYNEIIAVWEPLIERVDDGKQKWKLSLEMKTNPTRDRTPLQGDDSVVFSDPQTAITITSKDSMNITISRSTLAVFQSLAKVFSEGAAPSFDHTLKEKAPFTIQNSLGLPLVIQHNSQLRIVDKSGPGKLQEVAVDQCLDLTYSGFSAIQRQESCLLSIVPTGYSEICNIDINKPGRQLFNVRGTEVVSVVLQVDAKHGNKIITVRSPLQIKNHFSVPFAILKFCPSNAVLLNVGVVPPEKELHVTLESYRSQLFLLPVGSLEGQYQPSSTCISWKENVHTSSEVQSVLRCPPASDTNFLPLVVKVVAVPDDLSFIAKQGGEDWDPAYIIHLHPAVTIRNLLPYTMQYLLEGSAQFHEVPEGGMSDILNCQATGEIVELMLLNYHGRNWSGRMTIEERAVEKEELLSVSLISQTEENMVVELQVHASKSSRCLTLSFFSPYWIINKTSRVLQYKAEDVHVKHPADFRDVILFSFKKKNFFSKNKLQLSVSSSSWSDAFSLDTVGSYGCITCPDKNIAFLVGVSIQMSSFNLTRLVTFTPFYMLTNNTSYELEVGEILHEDGPSRIRWHYAGSKECVGLWPEQTTSKLCVRWVGSEVSSKSFYLNKQDSGTLLRIDGCGGLLVDVNTLDHSTVICLSDYYEGCAPALLINHTSSVSIQFQQSGCDVHHALRSGEVQRFAWDEPSGVRMLIWRIGEHQGELDLVKDEHGSVVIGGEYPVYWGSFLDGRQRVLLFTQDHALMAKARQAEDLEQCQQEVNVSLQNLGLSLINNQNKREIAYLGITSSGVVWEMKRKNRWKPFNQKNIGLLEKAYQHHVSANTGPSWVKMGERQSNLEVNFGEAPMQMRHPYSCPIRRNSLAGIQVEYKQSQHQRSLRARLYWLQIDNQLPGAIFPVVFHPVPPPKSLALDSVCPII